MFFWSKEIEKVDWNIVSFKDGTTVQIEESNKELFTEEAITGSQLQTKLINFLSKNLFKALSQVDYVWNDDADESRKKIIIDMMNVIIDNNVRITDIFLAFKLMTYELEAIINSVNETITAKDDESRIQSIGEQKLINISELFGATEKVPSILARNIRIKDLFNS